MGATTPYLFHHFRTTSRLLHRFSLNQLHLVNTNYCKGFALGNPMMIKKPTIAVYSDYRKSKNVSVDSISNDVFKEKTIS